MFVTLQPIGNVRCRLSDVIIRLLPAVSLKVMWLHWLPMEMWLLGGRLRKGDASPYWLLDTEKGLDLQQITLVFPQTAVYRFPGGGGLDDRKE